MDNGPEGITLRNFSFFLILICRRRHRAQAQAQAPAKQGFASARAARYSRPESAFFRVLSYLAPACTHTTPTVHTVRSLNNKVLSTVLVRTNVQRCSTFKIQNCDTNVESGQAKHARGLGGCPQRNRAHALGNIKISIHLQSARTNEL